MKATVNLEGLHKLASFHREQVLKAPRVGCFCCLTIFKPSEIEEWIDMRKPLNGKGRATGRTALCPHCSVDAVIPDRTYGFRLTKRLLVALSQRWFRPVSEQALTRLPPRA